MIQSIATYDEAGHVLFATFELAGGFKERTLVESLLPGDEVQLVPEPGNEFDPDAVAVLFRGVRIGYVPAGTGDNVNRIVAAVLTRLPVVCIVGVVNSKYSHIRERVRLSAYARTV